MDIAIAVLIFVFFIGLFYWFTFFYKSDEHPIEVERYLKQNMQGPFAPSLPEEKKTTP
jgi:hypothetical protein